MFNKKLLGIAAGVGFIASFIVGLTAGVSFGMLILRAFLSGVVCAVLAFGINLLVQKFLMVSSDDISTPTSTNSSGVDITIEDEELPEDKDGPSFYVADKKVMEHKNDKPSFFSTVNEDTATKTESESINQDNNVIKNDFPENKPMPDTSAKKDFSADLNDEELDDLPDIGSIVTDLESDDKELISDSSFATSKKTTATDEKSGDTQLMAQAIRTMLAKDG